MANFYNAEVYFGRGVAYDYAGAAGRRATTEISSAVITGDKRLPDRPPAEARELLAPLIEANELRQQRRYKDAIRVYLQALTRFGENADLLAAVSICQHLLSSEPAGSWQDSRDAIESMTQAIRLEPGRAEFHAQLAQYCSLDLNDYARAAAEYRKAIALNPNDARTLFSAASVYGVPEQVVTVGEAIGWMEDATRLAPGEVLYHARLAWLYHEAGRRADAVHEWTKALLCPRPLEGGYIEDAKLSSNQSARDGSV